jgi:hypothetical protein
MNEIFFYAAGSCCDENSGHGDDAHDHLPSANGGDEDGWKTESGNVVDVPVVPLFLRYGGDAYEAAVQETGKASAGVAVRRLDPLQDPR